VQPPASASASTRRSRASITATSTSSRCTPTRRSSCQRWPCRGPACVPWGVRTRACVHLCVGRPMRAVVTLANAHSAVVCVSATPHSSRGCSLNHTIRCARDGTRAACGTARRFGGGRPAHARTPAQSRRTLQRASHRPRHACIECGVSCAWPCIECHVSRGEPTAPQLVERTTQLRVLIRRHRESVARARRCGGASVSKCPAPMLQSR
jgi:hypothetical protein